MNVSHSFSPWPAPGAQADASDAAQPQTPLDIVFIEGFTAMTVIGIHGGEDRPQPLVIDLHAGVPRPRACDTDHIADTIDYSVVRTRLQRLMAEHRYKLLEPLAQALADILLDEFGAHWVRVKVVKPRKFDDVQAMGVQIERVRAARQPGPSHGAPVLRLIGAGMVPER